MTKKLENDIHKKNNTSKGAFITKISHICSQVKKK